MKILVIGYGNRSRRDDGVGAYVMEWLEEIRLPDVELLTSQQLEVDYAETITHYDVVIFVDAATQESPDLVTRRSVKGEFQSHAVAHYLTPSDLLSLSQSLYERQPEGILFSIRGKDFNFGTTLSPEVEYAARDVVRQIQQIVYLLRDCEAHRPGSHAIHA